MKQVMFVAVVITIVLGVAGYFVFDIGQQSDVLLAPQQEEWNAKDKLSSGSCESIIFDMFLLYKRLERIGEDGRVADIALAECLEANPSNVDACDEKKETVEYLEHEWELIDRDIQRLKERLKDCYNIRRRPGVLV